MCFRRGLLQSHMCSVKACVANRGTWNLKNGHLHISKGDAVGCIMENVRLSVL